MAINLFRKPNDPANPLDFLGPVQAGLYARSAARAVTPQPTTTPAPAPIATAAPAAPAAPAYTPPAKGTRRGSALFGSGFGGSNVGGFNINEWGAGLWGAGIDVNSPTLSKTVRDVYNAKMAGEGNDTDFQKRVAGELSKKGYSASNDKQLIDTVDWYYRDLGRRMDKSNSFFDSTIGKIVSVGATIAAAAFAPAVIPGITAAQAGAAAGAVLGGVQDGVKGALFGAVGGYGIGKGVQFVQGGGLTSLLSKSAPIVDGSTASVTKAAGAASVSVPSTGATTAGPSLLSRAGSAIKGAFTSSALDTTASVVNAGLGIRDLVAGGAAAGAGLLAAQTITASSGAPDATPAAPPPSQPKGDELEREKELRRRRLTQTEFTWGMTSLQPTVRRPTLLGGTTKLAA